MTPYTLEELVEIITGRVAAIQSEAMEAMSDLSMRQIAYLERIEQLAGPTLTELAETLAISKPSATNMVKQLEEEGYVQKIPSPEDGRSFHIHLTAKGEQLQRLHDALHRQIAAALTQNLDEAEVEQLTQLLNKSVAAWGVGSKS